MEVIDSNNLNCHNKTVEYYKILRVVLDWNPFFSLVYHVDYRFIIGADDQALYSTLIIDWKIDKRQITAIQICLPNDILLLVPTSTCKDAYRKNIIMKGLKCLP